jgi:hypothetical protein
MYFTLMHEPIRRRGEQRRRRTEGSIAITQVSIGGVPIDLNAKQDMTCSGELTGNRQTYHRVGHCHIEDVPAASKIILAACKYDGPCSISALVAPAGTPGKGVPQQYKVLKVYSARPGSDE